MNDQQNAKREVLEAYQFHHYVVYVGSVPDEIKDTIEAWLKPQNLMRITDDIWFYQARIKDIGLRQLLLEIRNKHKPGKEVAPFQIHFLKPAGKAVYDYSVPTR